MISKDIKRQEFIELLYMRKNKGQDEYKQLLDDLMSGIYTLQQCIDQYNTYEERAQSLEFFYAIKTKPLYKNIKKFMKDDLDDLECMKMISSILTQLFIHKQQNNNFIINKSIYDTLLNLNNIYNETGKVDREKLKKIINGLGYKEDGSRE